MSNNQSQAIAEAIACNFGAIDRDKRSDHADTAESIYTSTLEIKELPDGFGFRLPMENAMLGKISEWISNERLCCPFFTFAMIVHGETLWLHLTGTEEVKGYMKTIIVDPLYETGKLPDKEAWIEAHTPKDDVPVADAAGN